MTAMFPDSGVPASDAKNSILDPNTVNCSELWYSTSRCQPRFDPAAANAMLAELVNLINKGEVAYDCNQLNQVEVATRYLIQRGLPVGALMLGGPVAFTGILDPPATRHNDYMKVVVVPPVTGGANATLGFNGIPPMPIVRNDGVPVLSGDIVVNIPLILISWQGKWVIPYFVKSQLPVVQSANIDLYVNYAIGNDANDGTVNDVAHAVKNIQRAINIAFSYNPSQYIITIHVADSQLYTTWLTPAYPGPNITIVGNPATPANVLVNGGAQHACLVRGINSVTVNGCKHQTNTSGTSGPAGCFIASGYASLAVLNSENGPCQGAVFEGSGGNVLVYSHRFGGNPCGEFFWAADNGTVSLVMNAVYTILGGISVTYATAYATTGGLIGISPNLPVFVNGGMVSGQKYFADMGGIISVLGQGPNWMPGTIAGNVSNGGIYA